jgi:hypothetical protein
VVPTRQFLALCMCVVSAGCGSNGVASAGADQPNGEAAQVAAAEPRRCAAFSQADAPLPRVSSEELTLDYWLRQLGTQVDLDEVLLDESGIARLNASLSVPREDYHPQRDLTAPLDIAKLEEEVGERRAWARDKLSTHEYVDAAGAPLPASALSILDREVALQAVSPVTRVVLADTLIHCAPMPESFYSVTLDLRLDRNACSVLRAQDVVRVIAEWPNGMKLVEAAYSYGWVPGETPLSPILPDKLTDTFVHGPALEVVRAGLRVGSGQGEIELAPGSRLPAVDRRGQRAHVATAHGFVQTSPAQAELLRPTRRGLTRRALLEEAWRYLGTPYGLGDTAGGRDCSRLLLDVFASFDVALPRHSSWQSRAGSFWIDTERVPESERLPLFDAAAKQGIVLLHFPGHIMLYLGKNAQGRPMVLHALGEYAEPCAQGGPETLVRVKNITVSDLELGRGTSRKALLERVTRITVIGKNPGLDLAGVARLRPAAPAAPRAERRCADSESVALYALPEQPNGTQPLRIVSAVARDPGPAELSITDPDGLPVAPTLVRLGGPPYGQVATIDNPKRGRYRAVLADGDEVLACQTITVGARRPKPIEPDAGPIWKPKYRWNTANENLYALFVERLFDYELAEDRVWTNLHTLLRDKDRNLLYDYRGQGEDEVLELVPDCADLPYAMRSYFAWKMRLPFGFRRCTRGRAGRPPSCGEPGAADDLMSRLELPGKGGRMLPRDDIEAFELFINTQMLSAVHSSSGRTSPEDELTDYYPVALSREALAPGTVFADPYGHFLVLAKWLPQGPDNYGILVGVDAQPDGTIGQRRFWRGTFLFDPDTSGGGAGFKAFRPRSFVEEPTTVELEVDARAAANAERVTALENGSGTLDRSALATPPELARATAGAPPPSGGKQAVSVQRIGHLDSVDNEELRHSTRFRNLSLQQYQGSADDFYASVEALINPRPLEPKKMQRALIDALMEAVTRRVVSVANGEKWAVEHPGEIVPMPESDGIFLAAGPWEDFSTPSRDLRLLIAIDTVVGFARGVRQHPERFGIAADAVDARAGELEASLRAELAQRSFSYVRSDGQEQRLSLADVVARAPGFEIAYNPNDCVEVRWGAPAGSAELASCQRRAPEDQQAKLASYRGWFSTRKRPPQ